MEGKHSESRSTVREFIPLALALVACIFLVAGYFRFASVWQLESKAAELSQPFVEELEAARVGQEIRFEGILRNGAESVSPLNGQPCVAWHTTVTMESSTLREDLVTSQSGSRMPAGSSPPEEGASSESNAYLFKVQTKLPYSQSVYVDRRGPDELSFSVGRMSIRMPLSGWSPRSFFEKTVEKPPAFLASETLPRTTGQDLSGFTIKEARLLLDTPYMVVGKVAAIEPGGLLLENGDVLLGDQRSPRMSQLEKVKPVRNSGLCLLGLGLSWLGVAIALLPWGRWRRAA